jgi:hypothetical protein
MRWIYEDEYIEKEQRRIRGRWIILSVGHIRRGLCMCVQCNQAFATPHPTPPLMRSFTVQFSSAVSSLAPPPKHALL